MDLDPEEMTARELHLHLLGLPQSEQQDLIRSLPTGRRAELATYIQDFQRCLDGMGQHQEPDSEMDPTITGASLSPRSYASSEFESESLCDEADFTAEATDSATEPAQEIPASLAHEAMELLTSPVVLRALLRFLSESTPDARRTAIRNLTRERRHDLLAYMMSSEGRASSARTFGEEELLEPDFERLDTQSCQSTDSGGSVSGATLSEEEEEATEDNPEDELCDRGSGRVTSCSTSAAMPEPAWPSPTSAKRLQLVFMPRNALPLGALQPQPSASPGPHKMEAVDEWPDPPYKSIEPTGLHGASLREWLGGRLSGPLCWIQLLEGMQWARFSNRKQAKQLSETGDLYATSAASCYGGALGGMVGGVARALTTDVGSHLGGLFDCPDGPNRALADADAWLRRYSNGPAAEALLEGVSEDDIKLTFQRRCVATHPHRSSGDLEEYLQTHVNVEVLRQWQLMDEWTALAYEDIDADRFENSFCDTDLSKSICGKLADVKAGAKEASEEELEALNQKMRPHLLQLTWIKEKLEAEVSYLKSRGAYASIGVDPGASDAELARAYKVQALRLHPDRGGSTEAFQALQAAYERILKQRGGDGKKKTDDSKQTDSNCNGHGEEQDARQGDSDCEKSKDEAKQPNSKAKKQKKAAKSVAPSQQDGDHNVNQTDSKSQEQMKTATSDSPAQGNGDCDASQTNSTSKMQTAAAKPLSTSQEHGDCNTNHSDSTGKKQAKAAKPVSTSQEPGVCNANHSDSTGEKQAKAAKSVSISEENGDCDANHPDSTGEAKAAKSVSPPQQNGDCNKPAMFEEGLQDTEDIDADLWDAERLERSVTTAAEAIPAEIVSGQADAVLHGAQMCVRASQLCSKAAAVGPMAWPQLQRMMTHLLEAAQHVAETCGRVGHHTTSVPGTVMPLLDAVTKQSSRLRPSLVRQVVKGTRGLLGTVDGLPGMAKEIVLRQTILVHHIAEVMGTMENLIGRQVTSSTMCTSIAEVLETVARLAREAAEAVATAAIAVAETKRHAENLLEVLGAAGLWEKMDAEAGSNTKSGSKQEGARSDDDDSSDDEDKEPWEQNVEYASMLQSLNSEVLQLQQELRDLVSQDPALISAVNPSQKEVLFAIVAEMLSQARKKISRAWYSKCSRHAPEGATSFLAAVEKPLEFLVAAASWKQIAVPSLGARLLRLAALLDSQLLCNMLETDLFLHALGLAEGDERAQLRVRVSELSTKLQRGFGSSNLPNTSADAAAGV